ncbi:MAG: winged helix-turn-helix domain-containing protein [Rhodopila sp.]|jgi:predicted ATPase
MPEPVERTGGKIEFGPFTLAPAEQLLTRGGVAVSIGTRALDILIALVSCANEAVSKRDLIARVWPDVTVSENSLRFHVVSLRKALGDGVGGARYITTVTGRGYCFVAPVTAFNQAQNDTPAPDVPGNVPRANVPSPLARMVGRADGVRTLSGQLVATRFVTIVGAGGVGKTTVAVAVAHYLTNCFAGVVAFIDFGSLSEPGLAAFSLASLLGLSVQSEDPTLGLIAYLRDKRILLILDNCEHLIDATAPLAARIFAGAPGVHILATSREALRVEGEHVHRLAPLSFPPDDSGLTADAALTFPAVQLFVERAEASGARLALTGADAKIVGGICRRLDGVALAIELAAARVGTYGLEQTAALLNERFALVWSGQRTAPPRQQTLKAMLDWSYELLSDLEQKTLCRLAVFVGDFPLDAALAVSTSADLDQNHVLGALDNLVAKSMVATNRDGTIMRYRLLDTTRAYANEIGLDAADRAGLAARHAAYYRRWLAQPESGRPGSPESVERTISLADIGNVRAALEWCFGLSGDAEIGIGLAVAAAPAFFSMSLPIECQRWSERALLALDDATRAGREEMQLQATLGMSLLFTHGPCEEARVALTRSLAIAEEREDALTQMRLLSPLYILHTRSGNFYEAKRYSERASAISRTILDPAAVAFGDCCVGVALFYVGELAGSRVALEEALRAGPGSQRSSIKNFGFDYYNLSSVGLGLTLWLLGHPAQAVERARQAVRDAAGMDRQVALSIVLMWAICVFLWAGDLQSAEEHTDWFISRAESHSLAPYIAIGRGFKGELAIHRGNAKTGVEILQACLVDLHAVRYQALITPFSSSLAQGLAATGRYAEGITLIDQTIRQVEINGNLYYMPELLRVKGGLLLSMPRPAGEDAEFCFMRSIQLSRRQGALAWELRTSIDLAASLASRGLTENARTLLRPVLEQFVEGSETADLKAAQRLLATLA